MAPKSVLHFGVMVGFLATWLPGQQRLYTVVRPNAIHSNFGISVSDAGDVDGDGYPDIVSGDPRELPTGGVTRAAKVISGRTGLVIRTLGPLPSQPPNDDFGRAVSGAGDVNGDGYADVIVGAQWGRIPGGPQTGYALVFSGRDSSILHTLGLQPRHFVFGRAVSGAGDVNQDGYDDVVVGEGRSAEIYSGLDGSLLWRLMGPPPSSWFGEAVSDAGDTNGDGYPDVIVGASFLVYLGTEPGYAQVFSGKDGTLLRTINGPARLSGLGGSVSGVSDVDRDGCDDVMVSLRGLLPNPQARVYSGRTGDVIHTFTGPPGFPIGSPFISAYALSVSGAGDVNGDSYPDLIVGHPWDSTSGLTVGLVHVFSGKDGTKLFTVHGRPLLGGRAERFGESVSCAGDVNLDGFADLVVGAPLRLTSTGSLQGAVEVFSGVPLPLGTDTHEISLSTGGTQTFSLDAGVARAGLPYLLLGSASGLRPGVSFGAVTVPLNFDPYTVHTATFPNLPPLGNTFGMLDPAGMGTATFSIPPLPPELAGITLDHAFVTISGVSVSFASNSAPLSFVQ